MRRRPYNVVLFDEIEKAHTDIFNILLQVLDDGRLTDGQGRTVDFSNIVVIMTSNLGSQHLLNDVDLKSKADYSISNHARERVMDSVHGHFRPEFLNRLDDLIIFSPLSHNNLTNIVSSQLAEIQSRVNDKNITIHLSEEAMDYVLDEAYDPAFGARPLKRFLERHIVSAASLSSTLRDAHPLLFTLIR